MLTKGDLDRGRPLDGAAYAPQCRYRTAATSRELGPDYCLQDTRRCSSRGGTGRGRYSGTLGTNERACEPGQFPHPAGHRRHAVRRWGELGWAAERAGVPGGLFTTPGAGHVDAGQGACLMITERVVNKPPYPVKSSMDLSVPYSVGEGDSPKQLGFAVLSHEV